MEDNWGRWTPDIKDGSMSGGSDFEVIEEKEEEESQQQPNAEVGENGQQRSMVAAEDVNVPTGNGVELGWHMDNLNLGNMKRTMQVARILFLLITGCYNNKIDKAFLFGNCSHEWK
jgi:hypothetical protein